MARKSLFGSNLKMYKTTSQTIDYHLELTAKAKDISRHEMDPRSTNGPFVEK